MRDSYQDLAAAADESWAQAGGEEGGGGGAVRGACGPLFGLIDGTIEALRGSSPIQASAVLLCVVFAGALLNAVVEDEHVTVLSKGGDVCAGGRDLLEKANERCKVVNKLAEGFLNGEGWVKCADFTRGAELLRENRDSKGTFWYPTSEARKVAFFYSTCNPTCASGADEYLADVPSCNHGMCDGGMCRVQDGVVLAWMEARQLAGGLFSFGKDARGDVCRETQKSTPGLKAIERGTAEVEKGGFSIAHGEKYYNPEEARDVAHLYQECSGKCACLDTLDSTGTRCLIQDMDVRIFFDPSTKFGEVRGPHSERVNVMNAQCRGSQGEINRVRGEGGLRGGALEMSYLPSVADTMREIYSTCARHVSCPGDR